MDQKADNLTKDQVEKMIDLKVKDFFGKKIIGDNPTDALQLVNKRYFITGGPGSVIGYSSILTIDPTRGRLFIISTTSSVATITVNASVVGQFGQQLQVQVNNDSAGA